MNPTLDAFLRSWPTAPWLSGGLLVCAAVYARGYYRLARRDPRRWPIGRPVAMAGGLLAVWLALASPIEPFAGLLLQVHMTQHLLLMMVAPPLLWLAWPLAPLLLGLPRPWRVAWAVPLLRWPPLRALCTRLTHPVGAWLVFVGCTWLWHLPAVYDAALARDGLHYAQHVSFLLAALLFWYPVVRPFPSRPAWSAWWLFPYLLLADVQNTVLAALLTFSDRVLYAHYLDVPRVAGWSALDDQAIAGVIMWVPGSVAFLGPLFGLGVWMLYGPAPATRRQGAQPQTPRAGKPAAGYRSLPVLSVAAPAPRWDWLRLPLVGPLARWRYGRPIVQSLLLALAALVVYDGWRGPDVAAMNLAGVLPWIHWRGAVVIGLLVVGNLFCFACPFTLPRALARRWLPAGWSWPGRFRNKWLAVALVALFLWSYEAFALWDRPAWTATIVVGYFVAAFTVDALFRGAAFCKYVCPIGQFNFVQSLASPAEVAVRDPHVCSHCATHDCLHGGNGLEGCRLDLFPPRKSGNMDCTFCLDCVRACPHENIGVLVTAPVGDLWSDRLHAGLGRLTRRRDMAALVALLVFGALANAAGMVAPVVAWQQQLAAWWGWSSLAVVTAFYLLALGVLPVAGCLLAAMLSCRWARWSEGLFDTATRFAFALAPLGFGMWLAHYTFHLFTSFNSALPVTQRFVAERGWTLGGEPAWQCACCAEPTDWLLHLEMLFLHAGLLASWYVAYRIAAARADRLPRALAAFAPWGVLIAALFAAGVWTMLQPMEMRGTLELWP